MILNVYSGVLRAVGVTRGLSEEEWAERSHDCYIREAGYYSSDHEGVCIFAFH